ncbi:MAG: hypothetical protein AB1505_07890 [Candidatus Latescibacterota bacterium]
MLLAEEPQVGMMGGTGGVGMGSGVMDGMAGGAPRMGPRLRPVRDDWGRPVLESRQEPDTGADGRPLYDE